MKTYSPFLFPVIPLLLRWPHPGRILVVVVEILLWAGVDALSLIFAVEEIGLKGGQVELSRRLVNQEADLGLGVILKLGIDPFDRLFQSLLHSSRLRRRSPLTVHR